MRSPLQTIEQCNRKAPFCVLLFKNKIQMTKIKYWREFRDSLHLAKEQKREEALDCHCVNTHSLRYRGGGCSSPLPACRPCSRQSMSFVLLVNLENQMGNSSWLKGTQKQKGPNLLMPKGTDWLFLEDVSLSPIWLAITESLSKEEKCLLVEMLVQ